MLEYIFTYFKYWLKDAELLDNVNYFGIYDEQLLNSDNGGMNYPSILIDINIEPDIEQFAEKIQRCTVAVDIYNSIEIPADMSDSDKLTGYYLELMKMNDKIYAILEHTNGKLLPKFDAKNDKFFANSVHRYSTNLITYNGLVKTAKTTYKFMLDDFSAMTEWDTGTVADIKTNIQLKKN